MGKDGNLEYKNLEKFNLELISNLFKVGMGVCGVWVWGGVVRGVCWEVGVVLGCVWGVCVLDYRGCFVIRDSRSNYSRSSYSMLLVTLKII